MVASKRANEGVFLSFQYPIRNTGCKHDQFHAYCAQCQGRIPWSATHLGKESFLKKMEEKKKLVQIQSKLTNRSVNEGFSGGEKKKNEIFQMAMLEPELAILDETDSGLDIDALRVVAGGVNQLEIQ